MSDCLVAGSKGEFRSKQGFVLLNNICLKRGGKMLSRMLYR